MRAALVTEYRKLVTTRLWWILLLAMAVYMAFLAAVLGWGVSQGSGPVSTVLRQRVVAEEPLEPGFHAFEHGRRA